MAIDLARSRRKLPVPMVDRSSYSIFSVIKQAIGKDLTRFSIPVVWNEPLSLLQRLAESLEYSSLLDKAAVTECPVERLHLITAYVVSNLSTHLERGSKPFNPLLGETFELKSDGEQCFQYVAEQVSHHPPISAFHVRGRRWILDVRVEPRLTVQGTNLVANSDDLWRLRIFKDAKISRTSSQSSFHSCDDENEKKERNDLIINQDLDEDEYTWKSPNVLVHNLLFGCLWCEFQGEIDIRHIHSDQHSLLTIKPASWFASATTRAMELFKYSGFIYDGTQVIGRFQGDYAHCYYAIDDINDIEMKPSKFCQAGGHHCVHLNSNNLSSPPDCNLMLTQSSRLIWYRQFSSMTKDELQHRSQYYFFSPFALALNEPINVDCLPPSDSRRRMDIRYLEEGNLEAASNEKHRLEEQQRAEARVRQTVYQPLWFKKKSNGDYQFTGDYDQRNFNECPQLFQCSQSSDKSETVQ